MSPKEECEALMNNLLPIGKNFLKKSGEFHPYAAVMKINGTISLVEFYDGNEFPDSKELINNLKKSCMQFADKSEIKASGIVWNASIIDPHNNKEEDAILVSLEHRGKYSVLVALPYKRGLFKSVSFGKLVALMGERCIF